MSYNIPLFKLNFDHQEKEAVLKTIESEWISTGPRCEEFENMFASYVNSQYALTVSNCTSALHLALLCLGIGPGDEVICPSLTFAATVNAIKYTGATPVFCDIAGYDDLNIDHEKILQLINPSTKAIMVMHYAGFPCEMDKICDTAKKFGLKVIEDASHAPLSEFKSRKLGTYGDIGCFSFFSNKNISTGEGGMIVTDHEKIYSKAKLLRSHGMTTMSYQRALGHATSYDIEELGYNYRMDDIRASIGIIQLKKLKEDIEKRIILRELYIQKLKSHNEITLPFIHNNEFVSNYIFPIVLNKSDDNKRSKIRNSLHKQGIQTSIHYPSVHQFSIYKSLEIKLPFTEYVSNNEITLPLYGSLTREEVSYICDKLCYSLNYER